MKKNEKRRQAVKSWLTAKRKYKLAVRLKNKNLGKKKKILPKFPVWQKSCYPDFGPISCLRDVHLYLPVSSVETKSTGNSTYTSNNFKVYYMQFP